MFESQPSYVVCILRFGIELTTRIYFLYRRDAYLSRQRLSNLPLRSLRWRRAKTSRTPRTSETVCGPPFHELHATSHNFACLHSLCPRLLTSDDIRFQQIGYLRLYGEATTSSSYGGYGGNENNFDKFKYYYDIPVGWTQDTVNKVEKSTNGTDTRWSNPKLNSEKVYCVTLTGYNRLKEDRSGLLSDLALSDYNLQDAIIGADSVETSEREAFGQTYIDFDLYGYFGAIFACVTVYGGRLYALFSVVPDRCVFSSFT